MGEGFRETVIVFSVNASEETTDSLSISLPSWEGGLTADTLLPTEPIEGYLVAIFYPPIRWLGAHLLMSHQRMP